MGGFMAIPFALRYPERLDGLILISTMAEAYTDEELARNEQELERLLEGEYVSRSFASDQSMSQRASGSPALSSRP